MISKELLSEVDKDYKIDENGDVYYTTTDLIDVNRNYINIHSLAHKCKEWAIEEDIILLQIDVVLKHNYRVIVYCDNGEQPCFISTNEPEAIFKACQWVLENKDK